MGTGHGDGERHGDDELRRPGVSWSEPVSWGPTAPEMGSAAESPVPRWRGGWSIALLVLTGLVLLVGGVAVVAGRTHHGPEPIAASVPTPTQPVARPGPGQLPPGTCVNRTDGQVTYGNGPGGTASGPDAILAFQHAYYVERSGAAARGLGTVDGVMPAAEVIQAGIDSIPPGSAHCLAIMPQGTDRFLVELTETRPTGAVTVYRQIVTTAEQGGKTLIVGIAQAPD